MLAQLLLCQLISKCVDIFDSVNFQYRMSVTRDKIWSNILREKSDNVYHEIGSRDSRGREVPLDCN